MSGVDLICGPPSSRLHCEDAESLLPQHELPPEVRLSGKLELLDRMLPKLRKGGHKVSCAAATASQHRKPRMAGWRAVTFMQ